MSDITAGEMLRILIGARRATIELPSMRLTPQVLQDPSHRRLTSIAVSPTGRYMALGGDDETIKVRGGILSLRRDSRGRPRLAAAGARRFVGRRSLVSADPSEASRCFSRR